jgi:hypothetical protein
MGEITYPDGVVRAYLEEHFVPVRFNTIERRRSKRASTPAGRRPS